MEDSTDRLGTKTAFPTPHEPIARHKLLRITARSNQPNIPDTKASEFLVQAGLQSLAVGHPRMAYRGAADEQGRFFVNFTQTTGKHPGRFSLIRCENTETILVLEGTVSDIDDGGEDRIILQIQGNNSAVTTGQIVVEKRGIPVAGSDVTNEMTLSLGEQDVSPQAVAAPHSTTEAASPTAEPPHPQPVPPPTPRPKASPATKDGNDMLEQIRTAASGTVGHTGGVPTGLLENLLSRVRGEQIPLPPKPKPFPQPETETKPTETEEHMSRQLKQIRQRASEVLEVPIPTIRNSQERGEAARARQVIISIAKELDEKNPEILKALGLAEGATPVIYVAAEKVCERAKQDSDFAQKVNTLRTEFGLPPIVEATSGSSNAQNADKPRRGRPPGSKNKVAEVGHTEPPRADDETEAARTKRKPRKPKGDIALERDLHLIFGIACAPALFKGETLDPDLILKRAMYIAWYKKEAEPEAIAGVFEAANQTVDDVNRAIVEIAGLVRKKDPETLALLEEAERLLGD